MIAEPSGSSSPSEVGDASRPRSTFITALEAELDRRRGSDPVAGLYDALTRIVGDAPSHRE